MKHFIAGLMLLFCIIGCNDVKVELSFKKGAPVIIGDSVETNPGMIGDVGFYTIDKNNNIFVVDRAYKKIKKYSKDGVYISSFGNGEGRGPGEFVNPDGIDVDDEGNIYVMDSGKREVVIIDSLNQVKKILKTAFAPANLLVTKPGIIYLVGLPFTYNDELIYKYNINQKEGWEKPVLKFCERIDFKDNEAAKTNGARIGLVKDGKGCIYYIFPYPYEIRVFNEDGKIVNTIKREVSVFDPPRYDAKIDLKYIKIANILCDPIFIQENILGFRVFQDELNKNYCDFFDLGTKTYLGSINSEDLGVKKARQIKGDRQGNYYFSISNPYPHIEKAKLIIGNNK